MLALRRASIPKGLELQNGRDRAAAAVSAAGEWAGAACGRFW